jgi:hypothetical protein
MSLGCARVDIARKMSTEGKITQNITQNITEDLRDR